MQPLNNGTTMPLRGLLPSVNEPNRQKHLVRAIQQGYCLWDISPEENDTIEAVRKSGKKGLFCYATVEPGRDPKKVVEEVLSRTGLDHLDLCKLISLVSSEFAYLYMQYFHQDHWQNNVGLHDLVLYRYLKRKATQARNANNWIKVWRSMEQLGDRVRAIGLSRETTIDAMQTLLSEVTIKPAVVQTVATLENPKEEFVKFCREQNIHILSKLYSEDHIRQIHVPQEVEDIVRVHDTSLRSLVYHWHSESNEHYLIAMILS